MYNSVPWAARGDLMKIAFFTYPAAFQNVGGGEIQLLKTKEYLEKEGLRIDFFDMWNGKIENYDLLHVFGSVKECLGVVEIAKKRNVKVVISPVFWSDLRRAIYTEGGFRNKAEFLIRHLTKVVCPRFPSGRRKLFVNADRLLPNSEIEKQQIAKLFAIPCDKIRVVHNGVDERFLNSDPSLFRQKYGQDPFALSVGRIEPRKNQLTLIRAMNKVPEIRLVLIGSPVSGYEDYYEKCHKEARVDTLFLERLNHGDDMLSSAYAACEVFVLQGWFETPGLVALEAALAGARIIATSGGSTSEYFNDYVEYFDPSVPAAIARSIQAARRRPKEQVLRNYVRDHFTWNVCARETIDCYKDVLGLK